MSNKPTEGLSLNALHPSKYLKPFTLPFFGTKVDPYAVAAATARAGLPHLPHPALNPAITAQYEMFSFSLTHDPEVIKNPYFRIMFDGKANTSLISEFKPLQKRVFESMSPLWSNRQPGANANVKAAVTTPSFPVEVYPTIDDHSILFSVRHNILIQALHELYDPYYSPKSSQVPPLKSVDVVIAKVTAMKQAILDPIEKKFNEATQAYEARKQAAAAAQKPFQNYKPTREKVPNTQLGISLTNEFDTVLARLKEQPDLIENSEFVDYHTQIPVGAHLIYAFPTVLNMNAFHHGIYIGNKVVIEILNYKDPKKGFKTYQTVSHLNDFLKRAWTNYSPILLRTYNNPFPTDELCKRAIFSLGEFPGYDLSNENCETVASWIASNAWDQTHYCIGPQTVFRTAKGSRFTLGGGGRRKKTRKTKKRHTK